MMNITSVMSQEEIIRVVSGAVTTPSLIILWLSFFILLPIVAWLLKNKNTNWGRFFLMWVISAVLTGSLLIFLIYSPNTIADWFGWFVSKF